MDVERIKRWHWALIGLLAGCAFAAVRLFYGNDYDGRSLERNFDRYVVATAKAPIQQLFPREDTYLADVVVHPAEREGAEGKTVHWVSGKFVRVVPARDPVTKRYVVDPTTHALKYDPPTVTEFFHKAAAPYAPGNLDWVQSDFPLLKVTPGYAPPKRGAAYPDVRAYLDELRRKYGPDAVKYRYAWWELPAAAWSIYPLAGLLLIGGVWPSVLGLLVGVGLGRSADDRAAGDANLSRYKSTATAPAHQRSNELTDAERERLAAMADAIEQDLVASASAGGSAAASPAVAQASVRTLDATRLDAVQSSDRSPSAGKSFGAGGADYYPTEIHRPSEDDK